MGEFIWLNGEPWWLFPLTTGDRVVSAAKCGTAISVFVTQVNGSVCLFLGTGNRIDVSLARRLNVARGNEWDATEEEEERDRVQYFISVAEVNEWLQRVRDRFESHPTVRSTDSMLAFRSSSGRQFSRSDELVVKAWSFEALECVTVVLQFALAVDWFMTATVEVLHGDPVVMLLPVETGAGEPILVFVAQWFWVQL